MDNIYNLSRIGERIKQERKAAGLSQDELGERLTYKRQTIAKWEKGESFPELRDMLQMCNLFGCELGYLLCEYDCKTREATDIQEVTGLSELAIKILRAFNERVDIKSPMIFINSLLEDPKTIYIITLMVNELLYSNDDELTDAERFRMEGGRLWECQKALSELIEKIRREKHGTDN